MKEPIIQQLTNEKWLNLFNVSIEKKGKTINWIYCSRKKDQSAKAKNTPDAVIIVPIIARRGNYNLVLTKEYRAPLLDYEIGLPAGLIDNGETPEEAAIRELKEETNLDVVQILGTSPVIYGSAGLSDESFCYVFMEVDGRPSTKNAEETEDIKVIKVSDGQVKQLIDGKLGGQKIKLSAKAWPILFMLSLTNNFIDCLFS